MVSPAAPVRAQANTSGQDGRYGDLPATTERRSDGTLLVRCTVPLNPFPERLHNYLYQWEKARPDALFLAERRSGQQGWAKLSYGEAAQKARAIAQAIAARPLSENRPILILSGNGLDHALVALGAMTAGVPYAPISVAYSLVSQDLGKLRYILKLLDPGLIYASDARFARALTIPEMAGREIVLGQLDPGVPGAISLDALMKSGSADALAKASAKIGAETIAKFLFTSGSTGVPKGVISTHRMLCSNLEMLAQCWPFMSARPPVLLDWLPWSHVFGGNHNFNQVLRNGGALYIDDGKPIPAEFEKSIRNLREVSPTVYFNVPKGFEFLIGHLNNDAALRESFFRELDAMFYAAAALPQPVWVALEKLANNSGRTPIPSMISGWGLTETAPASLILNRHGAEPGNIGPLLPGQEMKLVPNEGKLESRLRGPNITPGYWKMPDMTAQAFDEEGFFKTGDALLFVDEKEPGRGFYFNGRVVEDFKLDSGTRVHVGDVYKRARQAAGSLVFDLVVAAPDRNELGLLIFPPAGQADDETYRQKLAEFIGRMNEGISGSSRVIRRAIVLPEPPSLDAGEMTDKGSLNSRGILERRKAWVDKLYDDSDPAVVRI
jgi:feruloyl-CoA synthase